MAKIVWSKDAVDDLSSLDRVIAKRIVHKLTWFGENFTNLTPESLSHQMKGLFKLRIGDWRVIYSVIKDNIVIEYVGHRSSIYKRSK